jgi:hypothetical protein
MAGLLSEFQGIVSWDSEATYATSPLSDPPATVYHTRDFKIEPKVVIVDPDRYTATQAGEAHDIIESHNEITGEIPLFGKESVAGDPPVGLDQIFQAAGLKKTVNAATDVTFNFTTLTGSMSDAPSISAVVYKRSIEDDTVRKIETRGARGNLEFMLEVGQEAYVTLNDWVGMYSELEAAAATPTLPTAYSADKGPMIVRNISITVDGETWEIEKLNLATNWTVEQLMIGDPGGGNGQLGKVLLLRPKSGARPGGSITLVDGSAALDQIRQAANMRQQFTLAASITNGTDTITMNSDGFQFGAMQGAPSSIYKFDVPYFLSRPAGTAGDDTEFSLVFT